MFAHRHRPRRPTAALSAAALVLCCAVAVLANAGGAAALGNFSQDLLDSCPGSGKPVPASTGPAKSCSWVFLDAAGRPIDSANGNSYGVPDPNRATPFWTGSAPIGSEFGNCTPQPASNTLSQATTSSLTTTSGWSIKVELNFFDFFKPEIEHTFSTSTTNARTDAVFNQVAVPAYHTLDWQVAHHMLRVQGAVHVVLKKWVSNPADPQGGVHANWYPPLTFEVPSADPVSGAWHRVVPSITPLDGRAITACQGSNLAALPLVSKYGTEHGTSPSGYCATATPAAVSRPCATATGITQDQQSFVLVPIPTTTNDQRYIIVNPTQDTCLTGDPSGLGAAVTAKPCDAASRYQVWTQQPNPAPVGSFQLANAATNLCMNAWGDRPASEYRINQAICGGYGTIGGDTQLWAFSTLPFPARATGAAPPPTAGIAARFTSVPRTDATGGRPQLTIQDTMIVLAPNASLRYTPVATGSPAPAISVRDLPPWLTFTNGTLTGVAPAGLGGPITVPVTFTASNGVVPVAVQTVIVSITSAGF